MGFVGLSGFRTGENEGIIHIRAQSLFSPSITTDRKPCPWDRRKFDARFDQFGGRHFQ